ncbi:hypothetical protein LGM63_05510 [Burkholderia cepacia]|nr:hypothetical protein [Burkholderia cepacia]
MLDKISGADAAFRGQIEDLYWCGKVGREPHPVRGYGCDVLPNGWTEISWDEFAKSSFFRYSPSPVRRSSFRRRRSGFGRSRSH